MYRKALWTSAIALVLACSSPPTEFTCSTDKDSAKADGQTSITVTCTVEKGGSPLNRGNVAFTQDTDGASFAPITDSTKPPLADQAKKQVNVTGGQAQVRVYSVTPATVNVQALFTDTVAKTTVTANTSMKFTGSVVPVSSFEYISADPEQVPLGGSSKIKFKALNSSGQPVAKLPVTFTVAPEGTATVDATGETIADGTVTTTLTGKTKGTVTVTIAAAANPEVKIASEVISISGGGINARNLSLVCPAYSIGGFQVYGLEMECTAYASDYSNGFVPNSRVTFLSEAGGVPQSVPLSSDPAKGGFAKFTYRTQCKEPRDVAPLGEAANDSGNLCTVWNQCKATPGSEVRTCNPRDGWATLVVYTTGGEAFQDSDDSGRWEPGEQFTDLPEPFVDADDNGTRDNDTDNVEDFYDANKNGQWDDKNGVWDENTAIWTSVKITWTGAPHELILTPGNDSGPGAGGASPHCTTIHYTGALKDVYGNPPTAVGSGDKVLATCTNNCKVTKVGGDVAAGAVDVTISDAHGCPAACVAPGCVPTPFTVDFDITRSLDTKGTSGSKKNEDLNGVIGVDPAPRTGIFE